jgi:vacuolar-type H+-ATPase subunit E/Vma4
MSAHKTSDDMRSNAQAEAARIVREAEGQVEILMQRTQAQLEDVQREIDGMRLKRRESELMLESIIAACRTRSSSCASRTSRKGRVRLMHIARTKPRNSKFN